MRTTGIALFALFALAACSTETIVRHTDTGEGQTPAGEEPGTSIDPNDPNAGIETTDPEAPQAPLATGLTLKDLAVYQGVKILVVKDGKWVSSRNAPVVAGRPALVRAFVTPDAAWEGKSVTAELRLESGSTKHPLIKDTKTITAASTDTDTKSTFNFEVPGELLTKDVTFSVALTMTGGEVPSAASPARFPADGTQKGLSAEVGGALKIVLVPIKYDYDGSGRTPDVTAKQVELYKQTFMAMYPTNEVQITVHAPHSWKSPIQGNGTGFSSVLRGITELRQQERPPADVYYYGLLAPTSSFSSFCSGGCVTGLSTVVSNPSTSYLRASVGVGFSGQSSANTMAHEVGHAHGREHAPCGGADGVDPDFPYTGAQLGVWGYNILTKTFISPTKGRDMMGYCPNEWVSDYTYAGLFDRISTISIPTTTKSGSLGGSGFQANVMRIATVAADGAVSLDGAQDISVSASDLTDGVEVEGIQGARYHAFDHMPGGFLVLPKSAITTSISRLNVNGIRPTLAR
jgi:hypothetical protein